MNHFDQLTDDELLGLARSGDRAAYGELYARYEAVGRRFARRLAGHAADDVLAEAFTKVLGAIHRGKGPSDSFRLYLFAAIRSVAQRNGSMMGRTVPVADLDVEGSPDGVLDDVLDAVDGPDRSVVLRAFGRLSKSQQEVLWYLDAEQRPPAELTDHFGLSPNAISARAYRARQALRRAFLELHFDVPSIDDRADCEAVRARLAQHLRDELDEVERDEIEEHLEGCPRCRGLLSQVAVLSNRLGAVVPLPGLVALALAAEPGSAPTPAAIGSVARGLRPRARWVRAVEPVRAAAALVAVAALAAGMTVHVRSRHDPAPLAAAPAGARVGGAPSTERAPADHRGGAPAGSGTDGAAAPEVALPPAAPRAPAPPPARPTPDPAPPTSGQRPQPAAHQPSRATGPEPTIPPGPAAPPGPSSPSVVHLELEAVGPVVAGRPAFVLGRATAVERGRLHVEVTPGAGAVLHDVEVAGGACGMAAGSCATDVEAGQVVELVAELAAGAVPFQVELRWWAEGPARAARSASADAIVRTVVPAAHGRAPDAVRVGGSAVAVASGTLVGCAPAVPDCPSSAPMVWRDDDADPATSVSSAAELPDAAGGPVRWARLYWAAELAPGAGASAPQAEARGSARLRLPGGAVAAVAADEVRDLGSRYLASADVTHLVGDGGRYEVADVQLGSGVGAWGAWVLVVIRAAEQPADGPMLPVVVTSPFARVEQADAQVVPLVVPERAMPAPVHLDVVAFGATVDRPGSLRWSEGRAATVLGGRSGAHGAHTPRLDHERLGAVTTRYGTVEVRSDRHADLVVGVVVAREGR